MKVSDENTLTFSGGLILNLLPADIELIELVSTTTMTAVTINIICYYRYLRKNYFVRIMIIN